MTLRKGTIVAGLVLAAATLDGTAQASSVLDQDNPNLPPYTSLANNFEYQQQVTAGISGTLAGVELYTIATPSTTDVVSIIVGQTTVFSAPEVLNASSSSPFTGGTFIDTSSAGLALAAGQSFVIDVVGSGSGNLAASTATYAGGALTEIVGGTVISPPPSIHSLAFQTYMSPVPVPGALPLMASGLAGLGLLARRRRSAAA